MEKVIVIIAAVVIVAVVMVGLGFSGGNEGEQDDGTDGVGPGYFD